MMITELTAEQQARFPEFIEKWTRIGLCTDPANRAKAEEGVRLFYQISGHVPPKEIVWYGSPLATGRARNFVRKSTPSIWDSIGNPVGPSAWSLVSSSVRSLVQDSVENSVWDMVRESVKNSVWESVWNSLWSVWSSLWDSIDASVADSIHGYYDVSWIAFYDYFRVVCGLSEQTEKMLGFLQVAETAGWWIPSMDVCWISERPNRLNRDDRGRLHCEDGPALSYPDGFAVYSIHGVRLDEQVVMSPRTQSADQIRTERNAEVKRIRIERFGWAEYLRAVGAVVLDTRDNDVESTKEALMRTPDGQHVVLVCACPSTSRVYCLEVTPWITTCEAAQDWLSGGLSHRVINGA